MPQSTRQTLVRSHKATVRDPVGSNRLVYDSLEYVSANLSNTWTASELRSPTPQAVSDHDNRQGLEEDTTRFEFC